MKRSQLQALIREALDEVLNEEELGVTNVDIQDPEKNNLIKKLRANNKSYKLVPEGELDEFARPAKGLRLADPNFDSTSFANKRVSGISIQDVIEFFRENPGAETRQMQDHFGFNRPQVANGVVKSLYDAGILVKLGAGGAVETPPPARVGDAEDDGEDELPGYEDPEGGYEGERSDAEIDAGFPQGPEEEEPETGEIEMGKVKGASMSDEEFEAWMAYQELERRLANVKSNLNKGSRSKSKPSGDDIQSGGQMYNMEELEKLKKRLEDKMMAIVSKFPTVAKDYKAPEIDNPEEEPLDEWTMNKMKYYAGILK